MKEENKFFKVLERIILLILILFFTLLVYCILIIVKQDRDSNISKNNSYFIEKKEKETNAIVTTEKNNRSIELLSKTVVGISKLKDNGSSILLNDGIKKLGNGSGFIVSEDGYICSNKHVSGGKYSNCFVTLENGKTFNGNVIWDDEKLDLSIVKINATNLDYIKLGNTQNLKLAENVYAIGNPIGYEFERTVTAGIISGLNRTIKVETNNNYFYMENLIQTDASINPGNSGGPLINNRGEVIGINSVKIVTAEGIGFAIPIDIIKPILKKIKETGKFETPSIGIIGFDNSLCKFINKEISLYNKKSIEGIYIEDIIKNSPANKLNILKGDILLTVDNKKFTRVIDLKEYIYYKNIGDNIKIKIYRNGKKIEKILKLEKKT